MNKAKRRSRKAKIHKCLINNNWFNKAVELNNKNWDMKRQIEKSNDDIQKVIDLLSSKIVTTNHLNIAVKKLEVIQDELVGVKEDEYSNRN